MPPSESYASGRHLSHGRRPSTSRRSEPSGSPPPSRASPTPGGRVPNLSIASRDGGGGGGGKGAQSNNVRVMVRVRPFSQAEVDTAKKTRTYMQSVIDMPRVDQVLLLDHEREYETKQAFSFDSVFWSLPDKQQKSPTGFATQRDVYVRTGAVALESAWDGFNSCVFAYGQTGSGKTHTMMGDPSKISQGGLAAEEVGVIPRLCQALFDEVDARKRLALKTGYQKDFIVQVAFFEIYNEKVKDLLHSASVCPSFVRTIRGEHPRDGSPSPRTPLVRPDGTQEELPPGLRIAPRQSGAASQFTMGTHPQRDPLDIAPKPEPDLKVRDHPTEGPILDGCTIHEPANYQDTISLINHGNKERSTAHTKMNDRSSRSHAIFRISLRQVSYIDKQRVGITGPGQQSSERRANINLVDLAGSENVKRSGASGTTMVEARQINTSLTTLRRVIDALIERRPRNVIPYRDSTLTWLLKNDLGGNSKCMMLATVSPHFENTIESFRTLQYAMRARSIVNTVRVNEDDTAALLDDLEKQIRKAQSEMDRQGISSEYREKMLDELQAAEAAKGELQDRLAQMEKTAARFQDELEIERRKRADAQMRQCHVMQMAEQMEKEGRDAHAAAGDQIEQMKTRLRALGHENVDTLAQSMRHIKEREGQLQEERKRWSDDLEQAKKRGEERLRELQRESEQMQGAEKERHLATRREVNKMREQYIELQNEVAEIEDAQREEKKRIVEGHDSVSRALMNEMRATVDRFEREKEQYHREAAELQERCQRQIRQAQHWADARLRVVQEHEHRLRADLSEGRAEADRRRQELDILLRAKDAQLVEMQDETEKELAAAQDRADGKLDALKAERDALLQRATEAEELAEQRVQERLEVQRRFRGVAEREATFRRAYEEITDFFDFIKATELDSSWTVREFGAVLLRFQQRQRAYRSHRPSREQLRQMLRDDPERSGADRMKALLAAHGEHPEPGADSMCSVLLDGLRCPDLPGAPRLASPAVDTDCASPSMPPSAMRSARGSSRDRLARSTTPLSRHVTPVAPQRAFHPGESPMLRQSSTTVTSQSSRTRRRSVGERKRPGLAMTPPEPQPRGPRRSGQRRPAA